MMHGGLTDIAGGTLCMGKPKGPYRYILSASVINYVHPLKEMPWLTDDLAALRKRAVKERRSLYANVEGSR